MRDRPPDQSAWKRGWESVGGLFGSPLFEGVHVLLGGGAVLAAVLLNSGDPPPPLIERAGVGVVVGLAAYLVLILLLWLFASGVAVLHQRDEARKVALGNLEGIASDISAGAILDLVSKARAEDHAQRAADQVRITQLEKRLEKLESQPLGPPIVGEGALTLPALTVRASGLVSMPRIIDFDLGEDVQAAVGLGDGVLEDLIVRVRSWKGLATVRVLVNGEPSSLLVSESGSGIFHDMTGTASVVPGDEVRCELIAEGRTVLSDPFTVL